MRDSVRPGGSVVYFVVLAVGLLAAVAGCGPSDSPYPGGSPPNEYFPPRAITVTATDTTLDFRWTAPGGGNPILDYKIRLNGSIIVTLPRTATSYRVTGLTPGTTYTYQVGVDNVGGAASASGPDTARTLDRPAPAHPVPVSA